MNGNYLFRYEKIGAITLVLPGLMADWLAGRQLNKEIF